jgi:hypothetical protein
MQKMLPFYSTVRVIMACSTAGQDCLYILWKPSTVGLPYLQVQTRRPNPVNVYVCCIFKIPLNIILPFMLNSSIWSLILWFSFFVCVVNFHYACFMIFHLNVMEHFSFRLGDTWIHLHILPGIASHGLITIILPSTVQHAYMWEVIDMILMVNIGVLTDLWPLSEIYLISNRVAVLFV